MLQNRFTYAEVLEAATQLAQNRPVETIESRAAKRAAWGSLLARYTRQRREELGLTVQQAAELSGLEISQWNALEAGWAPQDLNTIRAIAGTLRVRCTDYDVLAMISRCYQDRR